MYIFVYIIDFIYLFYYKTSKYFCNEVSSPLCGLNSFPQKLGMYAAKTVTLPPTATTTPYSAWTAQFLKIYIR